MLSRSTVTLASIPLCVLWVLAHFELLSPISSAAGRFLELDIKSGCQRKPGKMLKMSTEGGQQN